MDSAFRDDREALRQRLGALERQIEERIAGLTPLFWLTLDESLRAEMERLRPARGARLVASSSHQSLMSAVASAERYDALLHQALELLAVREVEWLALPDRPPEAPADPSHSVSTDAMDYVLLQGRLAAYGERLEAIFAQTEGLELTSRSTHQAWHWELVTLNTPVRASLGVNREAPVHPGELQITFTTSVSRRTAPIRLLPERWSDVILRTVGLRQDVSLGDPDFDSFFVVQGPVAALRILMTGPVRRSLLRIASEDVPWLATGGDAASISWGYMPSTTSVTHALRVLSALRRAPPTLHFRNAR